MKSSYKHIFYIRSKKLLKELIEKFAELTYMLVKTPKNRQKHGLFEINKAKSVKMETNIYFTYFSEILVLLFQELF